MAFLITNKRLHGTFRQGDLRWSKEKYKVAWVYLNPQQPPLYAVENMEGKLLENVCFIKSELKLL